MIVFVILSDIVITSKAVSQVSGEIPNIDIRTKWLTITYNMYQSFAGLRRKHSSLYWILAELSRFPYFTDWSQAGRADPHHQLVCDVF